MVVNGDQYVNFKLLTISIVKTKDINNMFKCGFSVKQPLNDLFSEYISNFTRLLP